MIDCLITLHACVLIITTLGTCMHAYHSCIKSIGVKLELRTSTTLHGSQAMLQAQ